MDIQILIAAHKQYRMPDDDMYLPVHVGKVFNDADFGYTGDNTGDHISSKNKNFCELTAIYWGWKNLDAEYIGLAHYRRHFSIQKKKDPWDAVLRRSQLEPMLKECPVIVPKKRNYVIETVYSHYVHTHDASHIEKTRQILASRCPEYTAAFEKVLKRRSAHMFNMMIMRKDYFDAYCAWLFDILFELEKQVDVTCLDAFNARLFGRISEFLLDTWMEKNQVPYKEIGYIYMEKIDWPRKIRSFLGAKFLGRKYDKSF
ncbi:MAG: DUF4422 domain-containing protein [Ruminococcus sp.]